MPLRMVSLLLAALILGLDRITKAWVEASVEVYSTTQVIPGFFNLVHTKNRGMAFGLFSGSHGPWRTAILIGLAGIVLGYVVVLVWRLPKEPALHQRWTPAALGLILGGAVGNLFDRVVQGSVTDFLEFYVGRFYWPAFNVADSAITVGAILMAFELLRTPKKTV